MDYKPWESLRAAAPGSRTRQAAGIHGQAGTMTPDPPFVVSSPGVLERTDRTISPRDSCAIFEQVSQGLLRARPPATAIDDLLRPITRATLGPSHGGGFRLRLRPNQPDVAGSPASSVPTPATSIPGLPLLRRTLQRPAGDDELGPTPTPCRAVPITCVSCSHTYSLHPPPARRLEVLKPGGIAAFTFSTKAPEEWPAAWTYGSYTADARRRPQRVPFVRPWFIAVPDALWQEQHYGVAAQARSLMRRELRRPEIIALSEGDAPAFSQSSRSSAGPSRNGCGAAG